MITVADTSATRPFQCPLCRRLFYFDNDYVKHKCVAKNAKVRWV